jgi:exopolysaccharide biosynthesis polyprenyl glycosylphosphotransferase
MRDIVRHIYLGRVAAVILSDGLCLLLAAALSWLWFSSQLSVEQLALGIALSAVLLFCSLYYCDAYRITRMGDSRKTTEAVLAAASLFTVVWLLPWRSALAEGISGILAVTGFMGFPLILFERDLMRRICAGTPKRIAVLGTGHLALAIARALSERRAMGVQFAGFIAEGPDAIGSNGPQLGHAGELEKILEQRRIDHLVYAVEERGAVAGKDVLLLAKFKGVPVDAGISFYARLTGCVYLHELPEDYLITADGCGMGLISRTLKRVLDVVGSAAGLVLGAPLLLLAASALAIEGWLRPHTRGPLLFRQARVGRDGRVFELLKLRSMVSTAEAVGGAQWAQGRGDPRVTRVGRVLRRTRLDEIPQLWNVLRGEMSLVGPRPERPEFVSMLSQRIPYFPLRCGVKPGLTGWAQVRHGYANDLEGAREKLAHDLFYIMNQSLLLDLSILVRTVRTVALLEGV